MDQIANMIQMIKNANRAEHEVVVVPFSKIKMAIAECLVRHGFIASVSKKMKKSFPVLEIALINTPNGPKVRDVSRISKSSRRMYTGVRGICRVKHGQGIMVLTTPKGILTDSEARKELVGGEVLFTMW